MAIQTYLVTVNEHATAYNGAARRDAVLAEDVLLVASPEPPRRQPVAAIYDAALPPLNEREPLPAPAPAAADADTAAADAVVPTGALDEKLSILKAAVDAGALSEALFEQARQELVAG